jgi:pectate lyase
LLHFFFIGACRYALARNSSLKPDIVDDFGSANSTLVDFDDDGNDAGFELLSNSTRRNLKQGKKKYLGPCKVTNPIDKCWRCRRNWARNRKRLAKCALGFGRRATGGLKGRVYVVTENSDDDVMNPKPGTLRHAVIQKGPLWIIFSKNMNIRLSKELIMTSHKTIDGRGHHIHIAYGAGITIQFIQNVIIHGIRIHHIVATSGGNIRDSVEHYGIRTNSDGDGISIFGSSNIWIDHVSMSRCTDGLIDAIMGSTAITISNSHFTHHNDVS